MKIYILNESIIDPLFAFNPRIAESKKKSPLRMSHLNWVWISKISKRSEREIGRDRYRPLPLVIRTPVRKPGRPYPGGAMRWICTKYASSAYDAVCMEADMWCSRHRMNVSGGMFHIGTKGIGFMRSTEGNAMRKKSWNHYETQICYSNYSNHKRIFENFS